MKAEVHWTGGSKMACFNAAKDRLDMDWNDGPSPMQVMLQAIGACTIADIVTGLKDRAFSEVWLELESERRPEPPRHFTKIHMVYHVRGEVPEKLLHRLIEKSHSTYCSASTSLRTDVEITFAAEVHAP